LNELELMFHGLISLALVADGLRNSRPWFEDRANEMLGTTAAGQRVDAVEARIIIARRKDRRFPANVRPAATVGGAKSFD
jgi:hypothetical protein